MAARYWVGGTATWDATVGTKWASTSGGAGGQTVPGTSDTVFFDAASGAVTCTWSATSPTVISITCTGFTGTLATGGNSKTLSGTGTVWTSPVTCTITGAPTFTINSAGSTLIAVTCNHASPSATNAPNFTFSTGTYPTTLSGTGFRSITVSAPSGSTFDGTVSLYGNLTIMSTSRTFLGFNPTFLAAATITTTSEVIGDTTVNAPGATVTTSGSLTMGSGDVFTLTAGTLSLGGTLSTGSFSSSNTNTRAIAFSTNSIALTSTTASTTVLSMADVTNFTYTGTGGFTRNNAATATVAFGTTGGSTTNARTLAVNAGSSNLTFSSGSWFKTLSFVGMSGGTILGSVNMAGNLTLTPVNTYSNFNPTFRDTASFNTLGVTAFGAITVNGTGITVTLSNTGSNNPVTSLTLTEGTLNITTNFNANSFSSSNSNVRALTLTAATTFTIASSGASAWDTSTTTNLTFTPNTATISMTSASAKTFAGGGLTYYKLNQGGAGTLTISGSNTFNDIDNTVQPNTVRFTAGTTQTVSNFGLSGTAGNLITIDTTSAGVQATLSKSSGTVDAQYLSIKDSNATGGAKWNSLTSNGNVNNGNNTGWIFSSPGNMFMMFI